MKKTARILGYLLKGLLALGILLFSLATFMGGSYLQSALLWLIVLLLFYWPSALRQKWNRQISGILRIACIIILFVANVIFFKPAPKTSIYLSEDLKDTIMHIYDQKVESWPQDTRDIYLQTSYGKVHALSCGSVENPPLLMFHAASMGAHSWAENLSPLLKHYCIYAIDNIGEGNKSELKDVLVYPDSPREIADLCALLADSLNIESSPVWGASNGGYISLCYAYFYPDRVSAVVLLGPMGLTQLTGSSIMMLSLATMYPFQAVRDYVARWALGDDAYCQAKYGDWFDAVMRGTIPSVSQPVPLTKDQKETLQMPVLLFLGTKDRIVGDTAKAMPEAKGYPNIEIEVLESGHLVGVEHAGYVNERAAAFLGLREEE